MSVSSKESKILIQVTKYPNIEKKNVYASQNQTILEALILNGIDINHSCGGMGTCGTCRIEVESALEGLPPPNDIEKEIISDRGFEPKERLSCQNKVSKNLKIKIP